METIRWIKAWVTRLRKMPPTVWSRSEVQRGGHLASSEKGQDSIIIGWINDNSKRCLLVEDVNIKLGSEEWLIRRHLE